MRFSLVPPTVAKSLLAVAKVAPNPMALTTKVLKGAVYLLLFHLLPLFTRPASEACLLMFLSVGMSNMITVFCFHLSHINEANAKAYNESFHRGIDWGAHQILTTANYLGSWTVFFGVTGMLEMQIEHHLFPGLSYANQLRIK